MSRSNVTATHRRAAIIAVCLMLFLSIPRRDHQDSVAAVPRRGFHILQVTEGPLQVRDAPAGETVFSYREGATFAVDFSQPQQTAGKLVWVQHEDGWTAIANEDGGAAFVAVVNEDTAHQTQFSAQDGAAPGDLPLINRLFSRSPVALEQTQWVQYFGNTNFAAQYGRDWNYHGYAQGLHGGLDFGNRYDVVPVYAAVAGEIERIGADFIYIRAGAYTIVYNHITLPQNLKKGDQVTADTIIGRLDDSPPNNRHIHLEVRYEDTDGQTWIVNPLLLLPKRLVRDITRQFDALQGNHFYFRLDWEQWITPLDQPIIKYSGPVIGPTA